LHVIDALCSHETDLDIHEHYTDTHGYTTHVFALCAFLGFRFAPRISNLLEQSLYTIGRPGDYGPFNALLKGRANTRVISRNWEQAARVAASIRHGTVSAALIMRKLAAYPRQNQVAQALHEIGQIEKTIHTLELLRDEQMRHRIERGLNKGELVNSAGAPSSLASAGVPRSGLPGSGASGRLSESVNRRHGRVDDRLSGRRRRGDAS
jgi:TnpA family transposase